MSAPHSLGDTGPKLKESSRPFSYALMDQVAPVPRFIWPSAMSPTGKLAGDLLRGIEEQQPKEEVKKAFDKKGDMWEDDGDVVEILVQKMGMRRLAGL